MTAELAFESWCDEIDKLARGAWPEQESYTTDTGRDDWRETFELGATPQQAWDDEVTAAMEM